MNYIFIHGLGQTSSTWEETINYLEGHFHVNCPNLFTLSNNQKISYESLYNVFKEYCDEFPGTLNLCGISLGSILALNYAIDNSEKVKSLVLIAPQYKMPRILLKFQSMLFHFMPKSFFRKVGIKKKTVIQLTNSMLNLNFSHHLQKISCPTLVICGTKDYANKKSAENLTNNMMKATSYFIDNIGHEVNVEAPKALATVLNTFYHSIY